MVSNRHTGTLNVIATPIGNLEDFSPRAVRLLKEADLILAEDTRHFGILAKHFGITTHSESYHEHNERDRTPRMIELLQQGSTIALVSDAGTPLISDPGYHLVKQAHEAGITVSTVPGPCAAIAALSCSGFATHRFQFEGFLPVKEGRRKSLLSEALQRPFPSIFYESPHRIEKTLTCLSELAPTTEVFFMREISKMHEEYFRGPASEALAFASTHQHLKGEMVLIVSGKTKANRQANDEDDS